jgi:hypothetical protein
MTATGAGDTVQTFRGFWHGSPLGPYQLLCLRSFVTHGHRVEVFSYDRGLAVPDWIIRRDANEILPGENVLHYRSGFGRGSPALHSDLFRYAMLRELGGWWIDLDVILLRADLPGDDLFFASMGEDGPGLNTAVMKFPAGHRLLGAAVERCLALGEDVSFWGQIGPTLLTELVRRYGLVSSVRPWSSVHPIPWFDVAALFDPARCEQVLQACAGSLFLHLFNEVWRTAGIPRELGPPQGSFLDRMFCEHGLDLGFRHRMNYADVARWISNRNEWVRLEVRCERLEAEHSALLASTSWRVTAPLRAGVTALQAMARLARGMQSRRAARP